MKLLFQPEHPPRPTCLSQGEAGPAPCRAPGPLAPLVRAASALALAGALATAPACTSFVTEAEIAYLHGRHLEVAEDLAKREDELSGLSRPEQARYCLYRGLALLQIGERMAAERWLCRCDAFAPSTPSGLTAPQLKRLKEGRATLDDCQSTTGGGAGRE
jgi:hypothetical protein